MYNPLSTRSKLPSQEKSYSARFFKKLSTTDQNERNFINAVERPQPKGCQSTKHIISLAQSEQKAKMFSKHKKPQLQVIALSKTISKANICLSQGDPSHHSSSKEPSKILRKDMSSKNLKLGSSCSSNEFPAILAKSVSQTTMHRKMDENKLKLLEKIGGKRRSEK